MNILLKLKQNSNNQSALFQIFRDLYKGYVYNEKVQNKRSFAPLNKIIYCK